MRAVNLIPADGRRSRGPMKVGSLGPSHALIGLLSVAVAFTLIYVLSGNTVSERTAKLAGLKAQVAQAQAAASSLATYTAFEQLAQQRSATVREIVSSRFDWDKALSELSRVVPADTSLQSLLGTVVPGVSIGGASGAASTGSLRTAISAPAFEMRGCTRNQDEVAGLMSRLRLINDVTRVTLADSQKSAAAATTGAVAASTGSSTGCPSSWPTFDVVVFFTPVPGAGPAGLASASGAAAPTAGAATPVSSVPTTPSATTPGATTTPTPTPAPGASSTATPTQAAHGALTTTQTTGATK